MELMTIQIILIVIAALILASLYWQDIKKRREEIREGKIGLLPSQKARSSKRPPRKRR
ncbi:MAG: hypothetical protein AB7I29_10650 [Geobacter sp.]